MKNQIHSAFYAAQDKTANRIEIKANINMGWNESAPWGILYKHLDSGKAVKGERSQNSLSDCHLAVFIARDREIETGRSEDRDNSC